MSNNENIISDSSNKQKEIKSYLPKELSLLEEVTDWYICRDIEKSFVFPSAIKVFNHVILKDFLNMLLKNFEIAYKKKLKQTEGKEFSEIFLKTDFLKKEYMFRGNKIKTIEGDCWNLRLLKNKVPRLVDLGMPRALIDVLTNKRLKSGLVLIVGETGNGKSTTCGSIINELCVERGSFALTIEDPPEMPLHGHLGKGVCIQTEVSKDGFANAIRSAMRSYPTANNSILYVGEIRDSETAKELIKVAANGHLVFTTIHGDSIISGLRRLVDMATDGDSARIKDVKTMLGSSLRLVVHQQLRNTSLNKEIKKEKTLKVSFLLSGGSQSQIANAIEKDNLDQVVPTVLSRQKMLLETKYIDGLLEEEFKEQK